MADPHLIAYPKANPLQFVRVNGGVNQYNFKYWDEWWQCERKVPQQGAVKYSQKIQQDQTVTIYWHSNNGGTTGATVKVYDMNWVDTGIAFSVSNTSVSGFELTDPYTGIAYTAYTHIAQQYMGTLGLADGRYIFVTETPFSDGIEYMISEPVYLRELHKNTMLIEYTNSVNDYDVFYVTHNILFTLRVESWLHSLVPNSIDTSYEDEQVDITPTYSVPYNTYTYSVRGVPEWMLTRVNFAFSADVKRFDGRLFTKDKDAKFELTGSNASGKKGASIQVREAINTYSTTVVNRQPILIWEILNNGDSGGSDRFPYFVRQARMQRTGQVAIRLMANLNGPQGPYPYTTDCKEVLSTVDEQTLLDHANNVTKPFYGQLGSYSLIVSGGNAALYYTPYYTEVNYTTIDSVVLSKHFKILFENGAYGSGQFYDIKGSWIGYALFNSIGSQRNAGYGNGNPATTYLVGGSLINMQDDNARVYHYNQMATSDTITSFNAQYSSQTPNILGIIATLPATLVYFRVRTGLSGGSYGSFNWNIMSPCAANIGDVTLSDNKITSTSGLGLYSFGSLPMLYSFDLFKNNLPTAGATGVDNMFNEMWSGGSGGQVYVLPFGGVNTSGQSPAAVPSAASLAARTGIAADSWAILTD